MTTPTTGPRRPVEQALEAALNDTATRTVPDSLTPPGMAQGSTPHSTRHWPRIVASLAAAAAVAGIAVAVSTLGGHTSPTPPATSPSVTRPAPTPTAGPTRPVVVGAFCDNFAATACTGPRNLPLWPFTSYTEAQQWYEANRDRAASAWQFDMVQVGNRYLHRILGLRGLSLISYAKDPLHPHERTDLVTVDVGYRSDGHVHTSGGLSIARFGSDHRHQWEVVGQARFLPLRTNFAVTLPLRGSVVRTTGTIQVSGRAGPPGGDVSIRAVTASGRTVGTGVGRVSGDGHWTGSVSATPSSGVFALVVTAGGTKQRPDYLAVDPVSAG